MDQLKEHPQIVELLDTLDKNGLMKEKNEVQSLVSSLVVVFVVENGRKFN